MNDLEFLDYCEYHAQTPRCGYTPEHLARLNRLAGREETATFLATLPKHQVINCNPGAIVLLASVARVIATKEGRNSGEHPQADGAG